MQGYKFIDEMQILHLGGRDTVLGMNGLKVHSQVLFDFIQPSFIFTRNGRFFSLKGTKESAEFHLIGSQGLKWY